MFGSKRHAEKKAAEEAAGQARTTELRDAVVKLIALAEGQAEPDPEWPLVLKHGERVFSEIRGAGLFEPRREPGHWSGRSAGVSVPVGDTRLRVRLGRSAGTYVQGVEKPTLIDTGKASVTTERVVFQGDKSHAGMGLLQADRSGPLFRRAGYGYPGFEPPKDLRDRVRRCPFTRTPPAGHDGGHRGL